MLVGDHPLNAPVHTHECWHSSIFECDFKEGAKAPPCPALRRVRCEGGPHLLLDEVYSDMFAHGWTLASDGTGWRCPTHKDAAGPAPKPRKRTRKQPAP